MKLGEKVEYMTGTQIDHAALFAILSSSGR